MSLSEWRKKIDLLDEKIIGLLNDRARIALEIGSLKNSAADEVYVPAREKKVLANISKLNKGPLDNNALQAVYREIMSCSLALEKDIRVAYFGPAATFTHQAARSRFGSNVQMLPCETISDVFGAVENQRAEYGVVPIENSTEGAVTHTLDEFFSTPLKIYAEIYLRISHHLLARVPRNRIKNIMSHPQVFGQCRNWLNREMPKAGLLPVTSTARAAEVAANDKQSAAIASKLAAEIYNLDILESDIQDMSGNITRFLVIGRSYGKATGSDKTSLLFSVKHEAGALHRALGAFKRYEINLMKIESRPSRMKAWEYFFFVDIEGHVDDEHVCKALGSLKKHCEFITVLGAYPCEKATQ